jgi:hypothetical protein
MFYIEQIKMAKSRTSKKQVKRMAYEMAEIQVAETLVNCYLTWWTKQEIQSLIKNGDLFILPLPNQGLQIAHFTITPANQLHEVQSGRSDKKLIFSDRLNALFYCLFECKKQFVYSAELLNQDELCRKLENDEKTYRHKYIMASSKKDYFQQDLCNARLSDTMPRLNFAREQLQKMIKRAKYIKIWD